MSSLLILIQLIPFFTSQLLKYEETPNFVVKDNVFICNPNADCDIFCPHQLHQCNNAKIECPVNKDFNCNVDCISESYDVCNNITINATESKSLQFRCHAYSDFTIHCPTNDRRGLNQCKINYWPREGIYCFDTHIQSTSFAKVMCSF